MKKPIIAAQLYTLRDFLAGKSETEIRRILTQVRHMGYTAVQISGVGEVTPELAETYKTICLDLALDICATHFSIDYMEENLEWVIEVHKKWQCSYAGIGSMPEELRTAEGLQIFIDRCNVLGKELNAEGIQLVYHNHRFEFEKLDGTPWLEILFKGFNSDYVQMELDTYWVQAGGANPVSWIDLAAGNLGIIHFKDMRVVKDEQQFAEIGQGNLEWPEIIAACRRAKVTYAAVEQDSNTEDPLNSLRMSFEYLEEIMA